MRHTMFQEDRTLCSAEDFAIYGHGRKPSVVKVFFLKYKSSVNLDICSFFSI